MEEETNGGLTTMETGGGNEEKSDALRIYVGGLGGTVKEDDLKKTFSAPQLGTVTAVDVIRTKGRSFAYLEFLPSSDKGLAKLFSLYNGCMWKGGKLRLEKAKEHYLIRMKREWDEDSELATDSSSHELESESVNSQDKLNKFTDMENMQLRLYFPRLGKVKSLPFKGTGKHKYSFQRIQVPTHPSHFCDCEEHSGALNISKEQSLVNHEIETVGVNEEELNMMNSVMNKLLQKENIPKVVTKSKVKPSVETQKVINSKDDLQIDEDKEEEEENHVSDDDVMINLMDGSNSNDLENQVSDDDDNLVINLSGRSNNGNLSALDSQELVLQELRKSKDKPAQKTNKTQKKKDLETNKRKDNVSDMLERKKRKILPSDTPEKKEGSDIIVQTNSESKTSQLSGKSSKKSVWKNLVSSSDNTTFQISDITTSVRDDDVIVPPVSDSLSGPLTEMEIEEPKVSASDPITDSLEIEEPKVSGDVEMLPESDNINDIEEPKVSGDVEILPELDTINDIEEPKVLSSDANVLTKGASWLQKSSWTKMVGDSKVSSFSISHILPDVTFEKHESQQQVNIDFSSSMNKKRQTYKEEVKHDSEVKIDKNKNNEASTSSLNGKKQENDMDGEFTFMRSSSSMKEWQKTKAAISGSLKKKGNKK